MSSNEILLNLRRTLMLNNVDLEKKILQYNIQLAITQIHTEPEQCNKLHLLKEGLTDCP